MSIEFSFFLEFYFFEKFKPENLIFRKKHTPDCNGANASAPADEAKRNREKPARPQNMVHFYIT